MIYKQVNQKLEMVLGNIEKVIIGKRDIAELSIVALLSGGHVLLEDVPGVGKTCHGKSIGKIDRRKL